MTDAFDLQAAVIVNAPDVRAWPVTATITRVEFSGGISRIFHTKQNGPDRWPDVTPPGWDGPVQYTWWLFRRLEGVWVGSAFLVMWYGRDGSGSAGDPDVPSRYHEHWYYGSRWAPLYASGPLEPGEPIGFMVTSGNQRDRVGPDSVHERSNVVVVPATDHGTFTFEETPIPDRPVDPVAPDPAPPTDVATQILAELRAIHAGIDALVRAVTDTNARDHA